MADLVGMLDAGTNNVQLVVAGVAEQEAVTARAVQYDMIRALSVQ